LLDSSGAAAPGAATGDELDNEMRQRRDIVVVGSSLGGAETLSRLLSSLPASFPAAVLIVQHMAPDSPKVFARMLSKAGPLNVEYGKEGDKITPGKVYLAPPDLHMVVRSIGSLGLEFGPKVRYSRPAADPLFESAARAYGPRVVGIVLSGGDGDGSKGLQAVSAAGGVSVVQEPSDARAPDMPISAIQNDHPSYVVPMAVMGPLLNWLTEGAIEPSA
jgi:two-component system chemotaxis response regulator CheB